MHRGGGRRSPARAAAQEAQPQPREGRTLTAPQPCEQVLDASLELLSGGSSGGFGKGALRRHEDVLLLLPPLDGLRDACTLRSTTAAFLLGFPVPRVCREQSVRVDVITLNYYSQTGFFKEEFREDLAPTPWLCLLPSHRVPESPGPVFISLCLHSIFSTSKAGTESRENKYAGRTEVRESCMGAI